MINKILITPKSFQNFKQEPIELLNQKGYEVIENTTGRTLTEEEIVDYAHHGVVGMIVGVDPISSSVLNCCKDLKAISKYGVGMDNIDLEVAKKLKIQVKNTMGTNNISVAELAIGLMFESTRRLSQTIANVKSNSWSRSIGSELTGKKVAVIGGGAIGKEVSKRCSALEMDVAIYDPFFSDQSFLKAYKVRHSEDFNELMKEADFITLHLPVTEQTKHLINRDVLSLMKESAILINTARGELIDEDALYRALVNNDIGFAAQDVYSHEPPEKGDKLISLSNFVLTPHIGAFTNEAVSRMALASTKNLLEMLEGVESHA
ncbi:phosphoglycerate dehydrogenase [Cytobacillus purgationiresistens]|uniref:D-3-phosphoglycerate dehydrogenase n=1 Tax=Cytobacillus purgationiresistens TaxID=863449 RepID=A0ABU0AIZ4_9BACI|nr:phosphoglycerate dehydrogenase [Cytobacillus purgationiresistens]MDQ0271005.1 D-3-phosphoglycerate dehydrogenase [Cytobacillus purgationiresistens]